MRATAGATTIADPTEVAVGNENSVADAELAERPSAELVS